MALGEAIESASAREHRKHRALKRKLHNKDFQLQIALAALTFGGTIAGFSILAGAVRKLANSFDSIIGAKLSATLRPAQLRLGLIRKGDQQAADNPPRRATV